MNYSGQSCIPTILHHLSQIGIILPVALTASRRPESNPVTYEPPFPVPPLPFPLPPPPPLPFPPPPPSPSPLPIIVPGIYPPPPPVYQRLRHAHAVL